jgi:hypothetical protein
MADTATIATLLQLAAGRFANISLAEHKLFEAATNGKDAECTSLSEKDRIIRGDVISWLCKNQDASAQVNRGVSIVGAQIEGELNLEWAKISFPLQVHKCVFKEAIILENSHLVALIFLDTSIKGLRARDLVVERSIILRTGFKAEGAVNFAGATIGENLESDGGQFNFKGDAPALNASGVKVEGSVFLRTGFKAEGAVNFAGATIGRNLECDGGRFDFKGNAPALNASGVKVEGSVFLRIGFQAEGAVNFVNATIGRNLECDGGRFNFEGDAPALNANSARIERSVLMGKGLKAEGTVDIAAAKIGIGLNCNGGWFVSDGRAPALNAYGAKIQGSVFMGQGFKAEGGVNLLWSVIEGPLNCSGGEFLAAGDAPALSANSARIQGGVFIREGFKAKETVDLIAAAIGTDLDCNGGQFEGTGEAPALNAYGAKIQGNVLLGKDKSKGEFKSKGPVKLIGATIGLNLNCGGGQFTGGEVRTGEVEVRALNADNAKIGGSVYFREKAAAEGVVRFAGASVSSSFQWWNLDSPEKAILDLRFAKVRTLLNHQNSWPAKGNLQVDGLVYDQIDTRAFPTAQAQLGWLHRQPPNQFLSQPYEQLAAVLSERGLEEDARRVMIAKNEDHAEHLNWRPAWLWYGLLGKLIGYGYRPWRAFIISLIVIGIGWLFFQLGYHSNLFIPTGDKAYVVEKDGTRRLKNGMPQISEDYPKFNAFVYSMESFVPLVKMGISDRWTPNAHSGTSLRLGIAALPGC